MPTSGWVPSIAHLDAELPIGVFRFLVLHVAVARSYGAYGEKLMYGRKLEGIVRSTFLIGADGRIEALWRPVRVPGHAEAVLLAATAR